ncbi:PAS domain S-box protein [Marinifilum sp. N1E240]|uniref:sensor histidine kinase n=1 Tax=Marinifilum sp. N1E240 TaxID=2608082 RepID=UPI00128D087B|nr:ABC transporter substrate binding protein [Marinifilum sp. N1E240]MPQ45395.1 PAS domain S-box protein [Marinifilum sp. N1E240]
MFSKSNTYKKIILFLGILSLFLFDASARRQKILVLHSYHQGLNWTDNITKGILSVLNQHEDIEIQFEYMDTKRRYDEEYLKEFKKLYRLKHKGIPYNVVIASDNNALYFTRDHQEEFFKNIPIVFCSIDQFEDSLIEGMTDITGVTEFIDFKQTVEQALRLHPKAKNLVVINDNITTSAIINRNHIISFWPELKTNVKLIFLENLSIQSLVEKVKNLDNSNIILLLNFSKDREGNYISYQENIEIIRDATELPIYSSWVFYFNEGIVGGMLTSGFKQGKLAAELAVKVINGTDVNSIPLVTEGYNAFMFDYNQMKRFKITVNNLPKESIVINQPPSFITKYKISIIVILISLGLLVLIIIYARYKRRINETRLIARNQQLKSSRNRLLRMLDANSDGVWEHNFKEHSTYISKNIWEKLGYDPDLVKNTPEFIEQLIHSEDIQEFIEERGKLQNGVIDLLVFEMRLKAKNNIWMWLKAKAKILDYSSEKQAINLVGTLIDITQRKQAEAKIKEDEKQIRASEERWRSLIEQAADEIIIHDFEGNILDVNLATCKLLGYDRKEIIGSNMTLLDQKYNLNQFKTQWNKLRPENASIKLESIQKRKNNTTFPVEIHLSLIDLTDTKLILSVASDISVRQETERKVLNAVIEAEENERKRFATDLHDSIGPLLSSINLYLSALSKSKLSERNEQIISSSREIVNETLINIKEISNNLSPHVLNDFGLVNAINSFISKINLSKTINITLDSKNLEERINQQIEVVIYRVITELINNTIKHAEANNIQISLSRENNSLNLIYIDDGKGFDPDEINSESTGMGLYNILSRIKSLNGSHNIQSNPETGGMIAVVNVNL